MSVKECQEASAGTKKFLSLDKSEVLTFFSSLTLLYFYLPSSQAPMLQRDASKIMQVQYSYQFHILSLFQNASPCEAHTRPKIIITIPII